MKRLSNSEILDARRDDNEFPPNTVGRQQADFAKSNEAAQGSMDARIAAAVADGNATPLWRGPRLNITEARRQAHAKLAAETAAKQRNQ